MKYVISYIIDFIVTIDWCKPKVRPLGIIEIYENKLYIQTSKAKEFSKQISKNHNIEICAYDNKDELRVIKF